jgi:hypothetical protein
MRPAAAGKWGKSLPREKKRIEKRGEGCYTDLCYVTLLKK